MKPRAHPYQSLPDSAFWRQSVAETPASDVDPVVATPFTLSRDDRVAAAGSCFAQHIGRYLSNAGLRYLVTEEAHPLADPATAHEFGYGVYTARFGNLYTARQLRQLLTRAYGTFRPRDDVWREADGTFVDPFRPRIQPKGFPTLAEYEADRAQHFACVRRALEELDVLVFTLGLTECWLSREDGAAYPLCPGVAGGTFDPTRHEFHNFTVDEIVADLTEFVADLRRVNPRARLILTVSPVPLIATASERHVLAATTYSKSVLRVAAETVSRTVEGTAYFPAYEIVSGNYTRGRYFASDLRSVTEDGVQHVMSVFLRHYAGTDIRRPSAPEKPARRGDQTLEEMERLVEVQCEEEALGSNGRG
jgi:GSCFA family protein